MDQTRPLAAMRAQMQASIDAATNLEGFLTAAKKILDEFPELRVAFAAEFRLLADGCPPEATAVSKVSVPALAIHEDETDRKSAVASEAGLSDEDSGTAAERVVEFFQDRNNEPASLAEIVAATGCPESTIKSVVYKRNADQFATRRKPGDRKTYWTLRCEVEATTESESTAGVADSTVRKIEEKEDRFADL